VFIKCQEFSPELVCPVHFYFTKQQNQTKATNSSNFTSARTDSERTVFCHSLQIPNREFGFQEEKHNFIV